MTRTNALIDNDLAQFTLNSESVIASEATSPVIASPLGHQNATTDGSGSFVLSNGNTIRRINSNSVSIWDTNHGSTVEGLEFVGDAVVALGSGGGLTKYDITDGSVIWENTQASNGPGSEVKTIGELPTGDIITSSGSNINRFSDTGDLLNENYVDTQNYFSDGFGGIDVYNHENSVLMSGFENIGNYNERAWAIKVDASTGSIDGSYNYGNDGANDAVSDFKAAIVSDDISKSDFIVANRDGRTYLDTGNSGGYSGSIDNWGEVANSFGSEFIFSSSSSTKKYNLATGSVTSIGSGGSAYAVSERESGENLYIADVNGLTSAYSLSEKYFRLGISNETNLNVDGQSIDSMRELIISGGAEINGDGVVSVLRVK